MKYNIMEKDMNELINTIKAISSQDKEGKILEEIFDFHFRQNDDNIIQNLTLHMNESFKINSGLIINYLQDEEQIITEEMFNNFKSVIEVINKLKKKYGFILKNTNIKNNNPYAITGMAMMVDNKETRFSLKINRADGESLIAITNANELLNMINFSLLNLNKILTEGVYNIDINTVNEYININSEVSKKLSILLESINK